MSFDVYSIEPYARKVGKIYTNGEVVDAGGNRVGKIFEDGQIKSTDGKVLGIIAREGRVQGPCSNLDIKFDLKGYAYIQGKKVGMIKETDRGISKILAQFGGCVLLLVGRQNQASLASTTISSPEKMEEVIQDTKEAVYRRLQEMPTRKQRSPFRE